jgi:hypothetical protein
MLVANACLSDSRVSLPLLRIFMTGRMNCFFLVGAKPESLGLPRSKADCLYDSFKTRKGTDLGVGV